MKKIMNTKKAAGKIAAVTLAGAVGVSTPAIVQAATLTEDVNGASYTSTTGGENALLVESGRVKASNVTVTKSGSGNGEDADFYGTNAAVLAKGGATLTLTGSSVTTDGAYANGVFSYGSGTTVNVSDTTIVTKSNNSGGIMTTGGATMNASNLEVTTYGGSSAAIRSDRGGGDVNVEGGSFTTSGVGSPAIYSTADITVTGATLNTSVSEAVVIEGGNSVTLNDCSVTGDNTRANGQATNLQNVFIYQSMSGDASEGTASFTMNGGTLTAESGDMFYVTNTTANINLNGVTLNYADGDLLVIQEDAWGNSGSNGGSVTFTASGQSLSGDIYVGSTSSLNLILNDGSDYEGDIDADGEVYVEVSDDSTWTLTKDTTITSLSCESDSIDLNGYTLLVDGEEYEEGTSSDGSEVSSDSSSSSGSSSTDTGTGTGTASEDGADLGNGTGSQSTQLRDGQRRGTNGELVDDEEIGELDENGERIARPLPEGEVAKAVRELPVAEGEERPAPVSEGERPDDLPVIESIDPQPEGTEPPVEPALSEELPKVQVIGAGTTGTSKSAEETKKTTSAQKNSATTNAQKTSIWSKLYDKVTGVVKK